MLNGRAYPGVPTQPNIVALGQLLYSRYLFAFEIAGPDPAGRDDRRDRPDPSQRARHAAAERLEADRAAVPATRSMTDPGVGEGMKL